jgi:hypothetical protein
MIAERDRAAPAHQQHGEHGVPEPPIMGTVVGLTFAFGFGDVPSLALRLGVPAWVAPLVAPAVDLSSFVYGAAHVGYSPPEKRAVHQVRQRDSRSARWVSSR